MAPPPPIQGVTKFNVDASFLQINGNACAGIVGKNFKAQIVTELTSKMRASSPLMAEALALREATLLAANLGMDQVLLESESLDLI